MSYYEQGTAFPQIFWTTKFLIFFFFYHFLYQFCVFFASYHVG